MESSPSDSIDMAAPGYEKAIDAEDLTKIYHGNIRAVDRVTFSIKSGEIFGLLGPNGAGKTTTIKMIVTLSSATSGKLQVFGVDAFKSPVTVRSMLGYVPQTISVDTDLTGYENLLIFAKLSYVPKKDRTERIWDALEYMGLKERAHDLVKHYSGGMMRRLEIAQAIVNRPRLLLLDEPTIGLDPSSKIHVWKSIKQLKQEYGTTVLITTHDMGEADDLCERIAIMSEGKIAVLGSPQELKRSVGGDVVTLHLSTPQPGIAIPKEIGSVIHSEAKMVQILTTNGEEAIPLIADYFRSQKVGIESISINRPNLDDVFMKYARKRLHEEQTVGAVRARREIARHMR
ncbi:MAG TPA: ATP-binding cassette domain-containing protein [Candidatus Nitrosotalea sp.]|nr:ATP-binding cassette domain-containing protein [Candidatus Nitrosotalea sp.]